MSRLVRLWHCVISLALGFAPGLAHASAPGELERLAQAVADHPEDPDLLFALAQSLAANEREAEAVERLDTLSRRFPNYSSGASLLLGRLLYELGRPGEAVPPLERAIALDPGSGPARIYLGLALKQTGRAEEAQTQFRMAAAISPELRGEGLLLEGLARLELGDRAGGDELLARAIDDDPAGESARSARLVLEGAGDRGRRLHLRAYGGVEYDSNVTLDSGDPFSGLPSSQSDGVFVWGSGIAFDAVQNERFDLSVGGIYDQTAHLELGDWDAQQFGGAVSAGWRAAESVGLRVDGGVAHARQGGDAYLLSGGLRPSLLFALGPRAGWLRGFGKTEWYDYDEEPFTSALEHDGFAFGGGLEHGAAIPGLRGAVATWYGGWERFDSQARRDDLLGFAGAYDHDAFGGGARLSLALPWRFSAELGVSFLRELYAHDNLIDALTDNGVGTATPSERRDSVWETRLRLARPLTRLIDVEVSCRYANRRSNVDVYGYDRWVTGLVVRVHTP